MCSRQLPVDNMTTTVVLASASTARANILSNAGIGAVQDASSLDESTIRVAAHAEGASAEACAVRLAEAKAIEVSNRHPGAWVIGADQILDHNGTWFEKSATQDSARATLLALRGTEHRLVSAVVLAIDQTVTWKDIKVARLVVRPFSKTFLDRYLDRAGDEILGSVGAYCLEGLGAQLFTAIDGDYFTILGLPLLPLLEALRTRGVLDA